LGSWYSRVCFSCGVWLGDTSTNPQVAIWTRWAEQEMAAGNIAALKSIFSRCLLDCPHVALWGVYIRFIKKVGLGSCTIVEGLTNVILATVLSLVLAPPVGVHAFCCPVCLPAVRCTSVCLQRPSHSTQWRVIPYS
jgi:hypothetical protein